MIHHDRLNRKNVRGKVKRLLLIVQIVVFVVILVRIWFSYTLL